MTVKQLHIYHVLISKRKQLLSQNFLHQGYTRQNLLYRVNIESVRLGIKSTGPLKCTSKVPPYLFDTKILNQAFVTPNVDENS